MIRAVVLWDHVWLFVGPIPVFSSGPFHAAATLLADSIVGKWPLGQWTPDQIRRARSLRAEADQLDLLRVRNRPYALVRNGGESIHMRFATLDAALESLGRSHAADPDAEHVVRRDTVWTQTGDAPRVKWEFGTPDPWRRDVQFSIESENVVVGMGPA